MPEDFEPGPVRYFRLNLQGREGASNWQSISGLDAEFSVAESKQVDKSGRPYNAKTVGQLKYSNVQLKRGLDQKMDLYKWVDEVFQKGPKGLRVDAVIEAVGQADDIIATYQLKQAFPVKYVAAALDASKDDVAVEELHLAHHGFERK